MTGDLLHLLALAVGLNLGIGALISFAEPSRQKLLSAMENIGIELENIYESDAHRDSDDLAKLMCSVGLEYLSIRDHYASSIRQYSFIYSKWIKLLVLFFAFVSFLSMIVCTAAPKIEIGVIYVILAACLSLLPIIMAISYFIIATGADSYVEPKLNSLRGVISEIVDPGFVLRRGTSRLPSILS